MVLLVYHFSVHAQSNYSDDMEGYADGATVCSNWWTDFNNDCSTPILVSSAESYSGNHSGVITGDGTTSVILDFGSHIFSAWNADMWLYIPSNKEASMNLQGQVPVGSGNSIVGNIHFNQNLSAPGEGYIEDTALGQVNFTFPHDQWFKMEFFFDIWSGISLAAWSLHIDGVEVIPVDTPFTDEAGSIPSSLGGLNFTSLNSDHLLYIDDICFRHTGDTNFCPTLGTENFQTVLFSVSPNPVTETLYIQSDRSPWQTATIYSLSGSKVVQTTSLESPAIDVSALSSGLYFVEITSEEGSEVIRFVKK
ncbi:MAG: hypothetical protein Aureis2KO_25380 [Aureisphaera sp.]